MEKFLESVDPYIIQIGVDKLTRETASLKHSINVLSAGLNHPETQRRIDKYSAELKRQIEILKQLKINIAKHGIASEDGKHFTTNANQ